SAPTTRLVLLSTGEEGARTIHPRAAALAHVALAASVVVARGLAAAMVALVRPSAENAVGVAGRVVLRILIGVAAVGAPTIRVVTEVRGIIGLAIVVVAPADIFRRTVARPLVRVVGVVFGKVGLAEVFAPRPVAK